MESLPGTADPAIQPAMAPPAVPALPRIVARHRTLIANAFLGGMIVASFLMAAGTASKHYGPTLHIHHGLPSSIRGPLHWFGVSLSGTEFAVLFIIIGLCYLGVLFFADSVRFRVGVGAILVLHLIFLVAPPVWAGPRCRQPCSSASTRSCWPTRSEEPTTICGCWLPPSAASIYCW